METVYFRVYPRSAFIDRSIKTLDWHSGEILSSVRVPDSEIVCDFCSSDIAAQNVKCIGNREALTQGDAPAGKAACYSCFNDFMTKARMSEIIPLKKPAGIPFVPGDGEDLMRDIQHAMDDEADAGAGDLDFHNEYDQ